MSDIKALTGVEIKDAEKGTVEAVFATLDVVDHDGDVTVKGAFTDGQPVRISAYGHKTWEGALPVGRGVIRSGEKEAVLEGRFFMGSDVGRNTFEVVKEMGDLQQWSYGFDVDDSTNEEREGKDVRVLRKLTVHEVSPVLLGAGVGTRTLVVKNAGFTDSTNDQATFSEEAAHALGSVRAFTLRAQRLGSLRAGEKEGRVLNAANREWLATLEAALGEARERMAALLAETDPNKHRDLLIRELMRFERARANF